MFMLDPTMKRDARSLSHETLEEMRRMAVKCVLEGETQRSVAKRFGVTYQIVGKWMSMYRKYGSDGLASSKSPGPARALSDRQIAKLLKTIIGKNPRQLNFGPALWTLPLVAQLIERLFGIVLHASTVGRLLHAMGLTPQRPTRRAFQRDAEEIARWMTNDFPRIAEEVRRKQAVLLFLDETGVHEDHAIGTTWAPRGATPVVEVSGSRRRVNVISAISPRGRIWFRCYYGTLNASRYVEFLKDLSASISKPIVLVHDRHPAHTAASTRRYLKDCGRKLVAHELPAYAPELNPDEHVWSLLKGAFRTRPLSRDEDLTERVTASMQRLSTDPIAVTKFFDHPAVKYVKEALDD